MPQDDQTKPPAVLPPVVEKRKQLRLHGVAVEDHYAWLKADNWQKVLRDPAVLPREIRAVLDAENAYADHVLTPFADLRKRLVAELRSRIKEDDRDVPVADGPYLYYHRYREGGEHPVFCRVPLNGGAEDVLLDGDAEGKGKAFFDIGDAGASPDHAMLAWSFDDKGSELYRVRLRDAGVVG